MHYPPPAERPLPGQLRAGAHSDLGMMTLIYSDNDVGGLEVMDRAGNWVAAPPSDGAFTVNLGDLMMRWTNDRWQSTLHRVVNPAEGDAWRSRRLSLGMFFIPNYDAEIAPLPNTGPGRYAPTRAATAPTASPARRARTWRIVREGPIDNRAGTVKQRDTRVSTPDAGFAMRIAIALAVLPVLLAGCTANIPVKADFGTSALVPSGDTPPEFAQLQRPMFLRRAARRQADLRDAPHGGGAKERRRRARTDRRGAAAAARTHDAVCRRRKTRLPP